MGHLSEEPAKVPPGTKLMEPFIQPLTRRKSPMQFFKVKQGGKQLSSCDLLQSNQRRVCTKTQWDSSHTCTRAQHVSRAPESNQLSTCARKMSVELPGAAPRWSLLSARTMLRFCSAGRWGGAGPGGGRGWVRVYAAGGEWGGRAGAWRFLDVVWRIMEREGYAVMRTALPPSI